MTRVLIVDDSFTEVHHLSNMLDKHGYSVMTSSTAQEGLDIAKRERTDVVMPGMNGFQATRELAKDQATQNIPVIIITIKDQDSDKVWGSRQGAKAYLTKPVSERQLLHTIGRVVKQ
jgi:twitching motility two-component system response regulator PilH